MAELNEFNERPQKAEENLADKKGIKMFFGNAEAKFFNNAGREITEKILQESFILYRIDLQKTRTHSLYGEAKRKVYLPEVEVFGRMNVQKVEIKTQVPGGIIKKAIGSFTAHVYLTHLEELGLVKMDGNNLKFLYHQGDFIGHKGQFYKITNDGFGDLTNQNSYGGDRRFYVTIEAIEVDEDVFKGR